MKWFHRLFPKTGVVRAQMRGGPEIRLGQRFVEAHVADEVEVSHIALEDVHGFRVTFDYRNYPGGFTMTYREVEAAIEYGVLEDAAAYVRRWHALTKA